MRTLQQNQSRPEMILEPPTEVQHGCEVSSHFILGETEALGFLKAVCLELGPSPAEQLGSSILLGSLPWLSHSRAYDTVWGCSQSLHDRLGQSC